MTFDLETAGLYLYCREPWSSKLANALGVHTNTIRRWRQNKKIPTDQQEEIEILMQHKKRKKTPRRPASELYGADQHKFMAADVYKAIDSLVLIGGYNSLSDMAIAASLDRTSLNPGKRIKANGDYKWPSLESVSLICNACGISGKEFGKLVDDCASGKI